MWSNSLVLICLMDHLQDGDQTVVDLVVLEQLRRGQDETAGQSVQLRDLLDRGQVRDVEQVVVPGSTPVILIRIQLVQVEIHVFYGSREVEREMLRWAGQDRGRRVLLEDVALNMFHEVLGRLVEVPHEVLEEQDEAREMQYLAGTQDAVPVDDLGTLADVDRGQEQDLLLLHQRQGVEQKEQKLGMLHGLGPRR